MNSTRTWVTPPREPVRPRTYRLCERNGMSRERGSRGTRNREWVKKRRVSEFSGMRWRKRNVSKTITRISTPRWGRHPLRSNISLHSCVALGDFWPLHGVGTSLGEGPGGSGLLGRLSPVTRPPIDSTASLQHPLHGPSILSTLSYAIPRRIHPIPSLRRGPIKHRNTRNANAP